MTLEGTSQQQPNSNSSQRPVSTCYVYMYLEVKHVYIAKIISEVH